MWIELFQNLFREHAVLCWNQLRLY